MTAFYNIATGAINDYKKFLRKNLPLSISNTKIKKLKIGRSQLKKYDEHRLFKIVQNIIKDVEGFAKSKEKKVHGAAKFLVHLKSRTSSYFIEQNEVVSLGQRASRALVAAIQLMSSKEDKLVGEAIEKVKECGHLVALHGDKEQKQIFSNAVKQQQSEELSFFDELFANFNDDSDEEVAFS